MCHNYMHGHQKQRASGSLCGINTSPASSHEALAGPPLRHICQEFKLVKMLLSQRSTICRKVNLSFFKHGMKSSAKSQSTAEVITFHACRNPVTTLLKYRLVFS